jgi:hypothetical protein
MLQKNIVIGGRYHAKAGGRLATVVVVRCLGQSRWGNRWKFECLTEDTKRKIKASGQRLMPLPRGPHMIDDAEWLARLHPAIDEYRGFLETKRDAENAKARRENRDLAASAKKANFTKQELRSKLTRLKGLLEHEDGRLLAIEFIKAADPWLLQALLAGTVVRRITDEYGHPAIEWEPGAFFRRLFRSSSQKDSCWETKQAQRPFWIPFWLTIIRATAEKCCPEECRLPDVWRFEAWARDEAECATLVDDILPGMTAVQQLELSFGSFQFSTARLPELPLLTSLIINGIHDEDEAKSYTYTLVIEALERFPHLKGVLLHNIVRLNVAADQEKLFQKVRLETCEGGYQTGDDGLRMLDKPPETTQCVADVNAVGARVLLAMARDYSTSDIAPAWWNPGWVTKEWWEPMYGEGQTVYGALEYTTHGKVDLSLCRALTPEVLALVKASGVPVVLPKKRPS